MSFFSGSTKTKTTQTTKGTPEQDAQFKDYFGLVGDLTAQGPQQYFQGDTVAGFSPEQLAAQQAAMNFAQGGAGDLYQQLLGAGNTADQFMQNAFADPSQQPGFQQVANWLTQQSNQNLTENLLPALESGSIVNGMMGGSGGDRTRALTAARSQQGLDGTLGQMLMQAYQGNQQNALSAMGMAPGLAGATAEMGLLPSTIMGRVGQQNQAMDQALINAAIDRWNFEQQAPYTHAGAIQGLQGNVGQYGGTTHTTQQTKTPFGFNQLLGSIGMLSAMGSPMYGGPGNMSQAPSNPGTSAPAGMSPSLYNNLTTDSNSIWNMNNMFPGLFGGGGGG